MCQNEVRDAFRVHYKWTVLEYAKVCRTVTKAYREFGVPKATFYDWKMAYDREGKAGLARNKPIAKNHPRSLFQDVVDRIPHLRKTYILGPERITWYLERYHGINIDKYNRSSGGPIFATHVDKTGQISGSSTKNGSPPTKLLH
jgi:hypothetical protein